MKNFDGLEQQIPQKHNSITSANWCLFFLCFLASAVGGTVSTLMSVYLPVVAKELLGNRNADQLTNISALINAVFILGWAFGGFSWGILSDSLGRKKALLMAILCYALATILTGFAPNWETLVLYRFFSGFGVGGVLVVSFTYMSEIWPIKTRAIFTGILSIAVPVGIFSAGLINFFVANWREGFYVGFIPLVISISSIWMIRESAVWLSNKTKQNTSKLKNLFDSHNRYNLLRGSVIFGSMLIGLWAIFSWLPTWVEVLVNRGNAPQERGLSMMLMGIGGLSGGFLSGWFSNWLGMRKAMLVCFGACSILSFLLFTTSAYTPFIFAEIGFLALFFGLSQGILSTYIPQLFSTNIRATATGFCFNIGRIFTALAVLFVGLLVNILGGYGNAIFLFSLVFMVGFLALMLLPEKGVKVKIQNLKP